MKVSTPRSLPSLDDKLLLEINDIVAVLPGNTIDDFLSAQSPSTLSPVTDSERKVFAYKMDGAQIVPLHSADLGHPLWAEICAAFESSEGREPALTLPEHLALFIEPDEESPARILVIPDSDMVRALQPRGEREQPTHSELRLLKQLICGMGLSEASRKDGVSHETKRTHYKSLSRKLGVRSQNQLTNRVLTRLLFDPQPSVNDKGLQPDEYFIELIRDFIPSARCFQLLGADGQRHRFVDIGPVSGRPVALVHPMILPDIRQDDIALMHEQGLRLIVPLRNGAMSKTPDRLSIAAHLNHACEGIELVRTHFAGEKLDLILCVSGCAYGIEYARRYPEHVRSIALVGACVQPTAGTGISGRLRKSLFALAGMNWRVYSETLIFFCQRMGQPETLRQLLLRHYRPCPADFSVVQREYTSSNGGERARKLFSASVESMTHDFYHQGSLEWEKLPCGTFPVAFIHGDRDTVHRIEDIHALAKSLGEVPVYTISNAGQLLYYEYFQPLLTRCSSFFASPTEPTAPDS